MTGKRKDRPGTAEAAAYGDGTDATPPRPHERPAKRRAAAAAKSPEAVESSSALTSSSSRGQTDEAVGPATSTSTRRTAAASAAAAEARGASCSTTSYGPSMADGTRYGPGLNVLAAVTAESATQNKAKAEAEAAEEQEKGEEKEAAEEQEREEEEEEKEETISCAICLGTFSSPTDLVILPCCSGPSNRWELSSTTRFCPSCIARVATTPRMIPYRITDPSDIYLGTCRVGECPRCNHLISVTNRRPGLGSVFPVIDSVPGGYGVRDIELRRATFDMVVRYAIEGAQARRDAAAPAAAAAVEAAAEAAAPAEAAAAAEAAAPAEAAAAAEAAAPAEAAAA
eukprot:CAMPEP_0178702420 /NCGR_PEP_ID=MMETSP0699-20121125/12881_1 /TAXON_ID=265572 /ORGANISM="Extubocellulus spinifer, Strain CCMP396" /LENGTH=340 /DNA_ID=CAMNT_0020349187 /DNA_START=13 /DNA_END=1033 /DNA_ORIENTATION=+